MHIIRKIAGAFRVVAGRKSIEPQLGECLKARNHSLDHLFFAKSILIEEKKKKKNSDSDDEGGEDLVDEGCLYVERVGVSPPHPQQCCNYCNKCTETVPISVSQNIV